MSQVAKGRAIKDRAPVRRSAPVEAATTGNALLAVRTVKGIACRWRCGRCFTPEPRIDAFAADEAALLRADPALVVESVVESADGHAEGTA